MPFCVWVLHGLLMLLCPEILELFFGSCHTKWLLARGLLLQPCHSLALT